MKLYGEPVRAIAGQKFGLQDVTESHVAGENITPGAPLFGAVGDDTVHNAHTNTVTLVGAADLVANNVLSVKVGDVELSVNYDTDTDKTLGAAADAISGNEKLDEAGIKAAVVAGARTLVVSGEVEGVEISISVTGGASQTTFAPSPSMDMKFVGVARHEELSFREGTGFYPKGVPVNVMTFGQIYVPVVGDADIADKKPAYVVISGDDKGKFTSESSGTYDCGCIFRSDVQDGLALVELRGLK